MRHLAFLLATAASCSPGAYAPRMLDADGVFPVPSADPERPRLRYRDGQVSRNRTCMVRLANKLNPAVPPMYVNGSPLGFC